MFFHKPTFQHTSKRLFRKIKHAMLVCAIQPLKRAPYFGKKFRHNASNVHFRREPIKFFGFHGFEGISFLFLSDLHIGGNIDHIADEVAQGIHRLLKHTNPKYTYILHGGDFISSMGQRHAVSYKNFTHVASKLFRGLESSKHFAVVGNHDEENPEFPEIKKWLEETYEMHFFTEPRHAKKIFIGEKNFCIHGIHTLAKHLHTMKKRERNMLLDQYIYTLNSMHNDCNIVLLHNPDGLEFLLARLKSTGQAITTPTLFLAGHTHGASLNFSRLRRLALFVCQTRFGRYKGWYFPEGKYANTGNWKMYVSTGLGNSPGCDVRINATPEVVLFTM